MAGQTYSGDGGAATNASLNYPFGVALDALATCILRTPSNSRIRKVDTNGIITTVAGWQFRRGRRRGHQRQPELTLRSGI